MDMVSPVRGIVQQDGLCGVKPVSFTGVATPVHNLVTKVAGENGKGHLQGDSSKVDIAKSSLKKCFAAGVPKNQPKGGVTKCLNRQKG